jgi:hypothetical protein
LQGKGIRPKLPLEQDLVLTDQSVSYDGGARAHPTPSTHTQPSASVTWPASQNGRPDFDRMTSKQRHAYDHDRLTRKFG